MIYFCIIVLAVFIISVIRKRLAIKSSKKRHPTARKI